MSESASYREVLIFPFGLRSDRIAVAVLFFVNGFMIGSWAPKVPGFMERLGISESVMGLMIVALGVGSIVMMPVVGALTARNGSAAVLRVVSLIALPQLLLVTLAPTLWTAAGAVFLFGGLIGGMDVAMNANAVEVEKRMRRPIMSSCHGFWSLGGLAGAALGGLLISRIGALGHAVVLTIAAIIPIVLILPMIAKDHPGPSAEARPRLALPRSPLPYLIGIMALASMVPEGAILDWGVLYVRRDLGADLQLAAFGFGAFSGTMALTRFLGDHIRQWLGAVVTLRVCTGFAMAGLLIAGMAPDPLYAIGGFAIAGIGISNMVPIAFSAAGNLPGLPPGIGISLVTVMGYSGILVAPSAIGFIAEHVGFGTVFASLAGVLLITLAFSSLARHANFQLD